MSKRFTLNRTDAKKILTGAAVALAGVVLTGTTELVTHVDLGNWTPYVVAGWSVVANVARKFLSDAPPIDAEKESTE